MLSQNLLITDPGSEGASPSEKLYSVFLFIAGLSLRDISERLCLTYASRESVRIWPLKRELKRTDFEYWVQLRTARVRLEGYIVETWYSDGLPQQIIAEGVDIRYIHRWLPIMIRVIKPNELSYKA